MVSVGLCLSTVGVNSGYSFRHIYFIVLSQITCNVYSIYKLYIISSI